jgi:regulation of enolase protein 1 (concanavalin A-like superfamily)
METIPWSAMTWINEPPSAVIDGQDLVVSSARESDFWQRTSYGFVRANGHVLGTPLAGEAAIEVGFRANFEAQFDQAGLMLWAAPELWLKSGVELSDGQLYASAVVTVGMSDWSVAPLPEAATGAALTFRASRSGDAVTVRYRIAAEPDWRFLRLAYLPPEARLVAGPMCCSPSRGGFSVRFESVRVGPPDAALHAE